MNPGLSIVAVALIGLFARVEAEPERHIYDRGEIAILVIRNFTSKPIAVGGCSPTSYQERVRGYWISDPLLRSACAFYTRPDGSHELEHYEIIRPRSSLRISFPTDWISETEAIIRVRQHVSIGCHPPKKDEPLHCSGTSILVTDPILIVEPGTADAFERR